MPNIQVFLNIQLIFPEITEYPLNENRSNNPLELDSTGGS